MLSRFSHVQFLVTPWTVACQAPLSRGFSRQEHWSGLPCPPPWESSWPRDQTLLCLLHHRQILYHWATWEAHTLFKYYPVIVLQCVGHVLGSFMLGLMMTSSKRAFATHYVSQVCFSQSPCPHGRPLLMRASTGDTQTLKGRSGSASVGLLGPGAHKVLFEPSKHLWWVWGLILNMILPLLPSCWGFSFAFGLCISFFGGIQHSSVDGCSATSCNSGVLAGEGEWMSCFSVILLYFLGLQTTADSDCSHEIKRRLLLRRKARPTC